MTTKCTIRKEKKKSNLAADVRDGLRRAPLVVGAAAAVSAAAVSAAAVVAVSFCSDRTVVG